MDIRYSTNPNDVKRYTTKELRKEFLITNLYQPDTVQAVYSHVDRMVVLGIMPVNEELPIDKGIDNRTGSELNIILVTARIERLCRCCRESDCDIGTVNDRIY